MIKPSGGALIFRNGPFSLGAMSNPPAEAGGFFDFNRVWSGLVALLGDPWSRGRREGAVPKSIVQAGLEDMDFVVIQKVVVKIHHVVLEFDRPVIPQSIFGAEAKQQSAGRVVKPTDIDVRPGGTHLAVDEPLIDEPAEPPSERG